MLYLSCDFANSECDLYETANNSGDIISIGPFSNFGSSNNLNNSYGELLNDVCSRYKNG